MQASKVSFTKETETRLKANKTGISRKHRFELRVNAILDYINSQPTGVPIKLSYILQAGGFDVSTPKEYNKGYAFITRAVKFGYVLREKIPGSMSSYWWDPRSSKAPEKVVRESKRVAQEQLELEEKKAVEKSPTRHALDEAAKKHIEALDDEMAKMREERAQVEQDEAKEFDRSPNGNAERFIRISKPRVESVVERIRVLGHTSNKNAYEYTDDQVHEMFDKISESLDKVYAKFKLVNPRRKNDAVDHMNDVVEESTPQVKPTLSLNDQSLVGLAKDFAWTHDSNSLRDFINWAEQQ